MDIRNDRRFNSVAWQSSIDLDAARALNHRRLVDRALFEVTLWALRPADIAAQCLRPKRTDLGVV